MAPVTTTLPHHSQNSRKREVLSSGQSRTADNKVKSQDSHGSLINLVDICECSVSSALYGVPSITNGRLSNWETRTTQEASLLIKLPSTHMVYKIVMHNKGTSSITLKVGLNASKLRGFCIVSDKQRLPHNRVTEVCLGHLPARYIHIICHSGFPIGFNCISVYGMSLGKLQQRFGQPALAPLMYNTPAKLLFGVDASGLVLKQHRKGHKDTEGAKR